MDQLALFIAIASFVFTLYQWLVTMNSRRPNLKILRFDLRSIFLNQDYKDFRASFTPDFIIVNLSELPNSVVDMKVSCRIGKKWHEGEPSYPNFKRCFPMMVSGHSSFSSSLQDAVFTFERYPSEQELSQLSFRIEFTDHYDKTYRLSIASRDISSEQIRRFPRLEENESLLGEVRNDHGKEPIIVKVVHRTKDEPKDMEIFIGEYSRNGAGRSGTGLRPEYVINQIANHPDEQRFLYHDLGSTKNYSKRVYLHVEKQIPKQVEVEVIQNEKCERKQFALPSEFVELCQSKE